MMFYSIKHIKLLIRKNIEHVFIIRKNEVYFIVNMEEEIPAFCLGVEERNSKCFHICKFEKFREIYFAQIPLKDIFATLNFATWT